MSDWPEVSIDAVARLRQQRYALVIVAAGWHRIGAGNDVLGAKP